jgi:hypothetical protein
MEWGLEIAKFAGLNSAQLAALKQNLLNIDAPGLAAGKLILTDAELHRRRLT